MFTYITTTTVPSFPDLQAQLGISYSQVNWTVAIPALGLSIGPLFWSPFADIYGRRIIFVLGTVIALASTIGAAKANDYGGYMAARFFQGFGVSPAATVGLAVVKDMFFEHERGQKMGLWVLALDSGLFVGPIVGGFLNLISSAWIQWFTAILFGCVLVLELVFMRETLYPRAYMLSLMPITSRESDTADIELSSKSTREAIEVDLKRTGNLRMLNIRPIPGIRHQPPWISLIRFMLVFKFSLVVIAVGTYCFAWYWWILSIVTIIPVAYVQYSPQIQGLFFLGLLLGTLFAEAFCSGSLSDYIVVKLARKNDGIRVPEMRLWLAYPAVLLTASTKWQLPLTLSHMLMCRFRWLNPLGHQHRQRLPLDDRANCIFRLYAFSIKPVKQVRNYKY
jgi:MFS family permease